MREIDVLFVTDEVLSLLCNIAYKHEDSGFELDGLHIFYLDPHSCFSDESEQDFSESFNSETRLTVHPPGRPRVQIQLRTTAATQEIDDIDAAINISHIEEKAIRRLSWNLTLYKGCLLSPDVDGAVEKSYIILLVTDETESLHITSGDYLLGVHSRTFWDKLLGIPTYKGKCACAWRLLVDNFIVKHISKCICAEAHCKIHNQKFAHLLKSREFSSLSSVRGELQENVIYFSVKFGMKTGVCHCVQALRLHVDSVKFSGSFVSIQNQFVRESYNKPMNFFILGNLKTLHRELLYMLTTSFT